MGVGIVVHHQVNGLHVSLGRHREVALDDHRNDAPILRRDRHVQGDVPALDRPAGRDFPQNPRDLLVGDLGVGIPGPIRQEAALIQQRAGGYQTTGGKEGASEEGAAGRLVAVGRGLFPGAMAVPLVSFTAALLLSTLSILSLGFVIASVVPTARFAQPIGAAVLYPMISLSGVFFPIARLPRGLQVVAYGLPTTHAVALKEEQRTGELRERFIAVLGHDVRNPLGAIMAAATVLEKTVTDIDGSEMTTLIRRSSGRISM